MEWADQRTTSVAKDELHLVNFNVQTHPCKVFSLKSVEIFLQIYKLKWNIDLFEIELFYEIRRNSVTLNWDTKGLTSWFCIESLRRSVMADTVDWKTLLQFQYAFSPSFVAFIPLGASHIPACPARWLLNNLRLNFFYKSSLSDGQELFMSVTHTLLQTEMFETEGSLPHALYSRILYKVSVNQRQQEFLPV